jgi:ferric-chelate reductase
MHSRVRPLTIILLEHIRWIEDILMPAIVGIPTSIEVAVKIYVTKSEKDSEKLENYESKTNESFVEELGPTDSSSTQPISRAVDSPYVSFESGRPDLQGIIQHEIEKASGRMSINGKPKLKSVQ